MRIADVELENRLHQLEKAIGAQQENFSRLAGQLRTNNLLETVRELSTKTALLQVYGSLYTFYSFKPKQNKF